jgi:hypothetical protein
MRRVAAAPMELALVLPLLAALLVGIFTLGRATFAKTSAVTQSRNQAWKKRPDAAAGQTLRLLHDPLASEVSAQSLKTLSPTPVLRKAYQADSRNSTIGHSWDSRALPFRPGQPDFQPHLDELKLAAQNVPGVSPVLVAGLRAFAVTINPATNPVLVVAAAVGSVLNPVVAVTGWTLKYITSPIVQVARLAVEALKALAEATFQFGLARKLGKIIDLMSLALESFDNLYKASRGLPGKWDPNTANRIQGAIP